MQGAVATFIIVFLAVVIAVWLMPPTGQFAIKAG